MSASRHVDESEARLENVQVGQPSSTSAAIYARIVSGVIVVGLFNPDWMPGAIGTAIAQQQLRSVLGFCNAPQMNAPEAYIQFKQGLINDQGDVTVDSTREFLRKYMEAFARWIERLG